ncbi:hypothetical protein L1987_60448 [Smallanthus sonchifolius]|uniref:Uncharacterized protein n=1 Tax=Smallanthus sonchifolius TaxID=185202 RepID=A0ACB9D8I0_9ASTR|nr:hypothetical protein L1987_60448 [Smallanthus sonchifolius]
MIELKDFDGSLTIHTTNKGCVLIQEIKGKLHDTSSKLAYKCWNQVLIPFASRQKEAKISFFGIAPASSG